MKAHTEKIVLQKIKEYEEKYKKIVTEEMKYLYTVYLNIFIMMRFNKKDVWVQTLLKNEFYYIEVEAKKVKIGKKNKLRIINEGLSGFFRIYRDSLFTAKEASKAFYLLSKKMGIKNKK